MQRKKRFPSATEILIFEKNVRILSYASRHRYSVLDKYDTTLVEWRKEGLSFNSIANALKRLKIKELKTVNKTTVYRWFKKNYASLCKNPKPSEQDLFYSS